MAMSMPKVVMPTMGGFGAPPPPPQGGFSKAGEEAKPYVSNGTMTLSKGGGEAHMSKGGGDYFPGGVAKGGSMLPPPPPRGHSGMEDPAAKRQRMDQTMPPGPPPGGAFPGQPGWQGTQPPPPPPEKQAAVPSALPKPRKITEEDITRRDQWAQVFTQFMEGDIESRAGEYAEAVVALWKQADSLRRQLSTVQDSCDQLLLTANREALRSHIQGLIVSASMGVPQDILDAARRDVEANMPAEPSASSRSPAVSTTAPVGNQWGAVQPKAAFSPIGMPMSQSQLDHTNLYVSGLPPGIDDNMFRMLFASYGVITSSKVFPEKCYGFVKFSVPQDAQSAIDALHNFEFNGTRLSVKFADRDSSLSGGAVPGLEQAAAVAAAATFGSVTPRPPASTVIGDQGRAGQPTLL